MTDVALPQVPLTSELATALALAAADHQPGIVVMAFDHEGLLLAVRLVDGYKPATVTDSCRTLLGLLSDQGQLGPAVVVAVQPPFGTAGTRAEWSQLRQCFEDAGSTLMDWLLVDAANRAVSLGG